ncbi:MAG: hypothetical protein J2P35_08640 [Actinobacteria bacterium]|nr:hypothetical protein [Actinomycetota bacterium]MBO0785514.1 hypothetical protein [Actinomycetota bacterium]
MTAPHDDRDPLGRHDGWLAIQALAERMEAALAGLRERRDPRRFFHATYLHTTRAVGEELAAGGFADPAWVARWDVAFAGLYLDALASSRRGGPVPAPWAAAFAAADDRHRSLPPLRHVLLGMNAHINYDLPQALLAVISDAGFADPALLARRSGDHRHIDRVLCALIDGGQPVPGTGRPGRGLRHALAAAAGRAASKRFLTEARGKVWANARILAAARRQGEAAYRARLAELERLSAARVAHLTRPGPVLLRLAAGGFGVTLRPGPSPAPAAPGGTAPAAAPPVTAPETTR